MDAQENKTWKTVATLDNYNAAAKLKLELTNAHALVKIKRGYPNIYRIKVWDPPAEKKENKEISSTLEKKKFKKGQNNRRTKRSVKNDEKICSR